MIYQGVIINADMQANNVSLCIILPRLTNLKGVTMQRLVIVVCKFDLCIDPILFFLVNYHRCTFITCKLVNDIEFY